MTPRKALPVGSNKGSAAYISKRRLIYKGCTTHSGEKKKKDDHDTKGKDPVRLLNVRLFVNLTCASDSQVSPFTTPRALLYVFLQSYR